MNYTSSTLTASWSARARHLLARVLTFASFAFAGLMLGPNAQAASSPGGGGDQQIVEQLLSAMSQNDYQAFTAQGTQEFAALDQAQFSQVATSLAPRLQQGYSVKHLGNLQQQGLEISVWKLSFKDGGDDLLATLNVQNGRVGGFFLR